MNHHHYNNHKRPYDHRDADRGQPQKKHKQHDRREQDRQDARLHHHHHHHQKTYSPAYAHDEAFNKLPPLVAHLGSVPGHTPFTTPKGLPSLPDITDPALKDAPFRHKSTVNDYNRSANSTDITYEKLEFLGDAYLELLASRLLYTRFPHITAGQQSQLRELLVKNETLAQYAHTYNFDRRVQVGDLERMQQDSKERGNKGFNKVLGDVFEAYIAAVILSSPDEGFAIAEKWMQSLWAPKLLEAAEKERYYTPGLTLEHADGEGSETGPDPLKIYNPTAKADLQKKIVGAKVKLDYQPYRDSVELKGDQLGQNRHYIAVYLTGYGYERKLLGRGEGKNKVEAGNWAAQEAMFGPEKEVVRKCEEELRVAREEKKRDREAKESAEKEGNA
ncbi:hypothetical protein KC340_g746 [Hortaea werneckii]|nr:hypothetical protein KC342_g310 [Hortaea werneckii]KAI7109821.1 hypothetical protein KC339_g460 [Hortaea werneckii]KAI7245652.1 hypothetical protein KC365_g256 [Hortaea werneckii]KAI7339011.1 hypothetical protein KC340_g746 [Hortaea werneckii]